MDRKPNLRSNSGMSERTCKRIHSTQKRVAYVTRRQTAARKSQQSVKAVDKKKSQLTKSARLTKREGKVLKKLTSTNSTSNSLKDNKGDMKRIADVTRRTTATKKNLRFQTDQSNPVNGKDKLSQTACSWKTRHTCPYQLRSMGKRFSRRREEAYHMNKDDHLALKDDVETERLEPQNAEVRKQKERLQTDKMEVRARVVDQATSDGASVADRDEVEIIYEGQDEIATLRDHYKSCPKSARHPEYIPVPDFCMEHLPLQYRTERVLAMVKAQVKLTVLLRVGTTSGERAKYFPGTAKNARRWGSGCVRDVIEYPNEKEEDVKCSCIICQISEKPSISYAKIVIVTAAHVVFDLAEGRKTVCYFDFDCDSTDLGSCRQLGTAVKVWSYGVRDVSYVTFVTHDVEWARQLKETLKTYDHLRDEIHREYVVKVNDDVREENLLDNISALYKDYQKVMEKLSEWMKSCRNMTKTEAERMLEEYKSKYKMEPSDRVVSFHGVLLVSRICDGDGWRRDLRYVSDVYESCGGDMAGVRDLEENYQSYVQAHGVQWMIDKYTGYRDGLADLSWVLACMTDDDSFVIGELSYYTPSDSLTIIASHPHGFWKQISIGQAKTRDPHKDHHMASYSYTAPTCNGSSGAYVYMLGRTGRWWGYSTCPHSQSENINLNKSAVIDD